MSLWSDSRNRTSRPKATFLGDQGNPGNIPRRSPAHFYFHQDFSSYQDRIFLLFLRDRLIWLNGLDEDDPIVNKLLEIAHRCPRNVNSSSATGL